MALARIITRSHACSRELALDLLARGYAVEIVSPDAIPDNIADLELRVEEGPGNQLVASVETHDGERSASLEFLHYLKAPMADFVRRSPEPREAAHHAEHPVSLNAESSVERAKLPAEASAVMSQTVSPPRETASEFEEGAHLISAPISPPTISPQAQLTSPRIEVPGYFPVNDSAAVGSTIIEATTVRPDSPPLRRYRPAAWPLRAALTFSGVIVLALLLGFGIRRNGQASVLSSGAEPIEKVAAASADASLSGAADSGSAPRKDSGQVAASAKSSTTIPDANSVGVPKETAVAKSAATIASPQPKISRRHEDDLIAPNTVTYLDKRFEQRAFNKPVKKANVNVSKHLARRHSNSRRHRDPVIADNKATYLTKPATKGAK